MRALIVYESMYGNTAEIARAIAEGIIAADGEATLRNVDDVMPTEVTDHELVVAGGPTHAHGMSRATTRATAAQDTMNTYEDPTVGPGLRGWLDSLPAGDGRAAAAFDTRIDAPAFLTGAASKGIERQLEHRGYHVYLPRESFLVTKENRLIDGEMERARAWGTSLRNATRKAIPA